MQSERKIGRLRVGRSMLGRYLLGCGCRILGCCVAQAKQKDEHFEAVNGVGKVDYIHLT